MKLYQFGIINGSIYVCTSITETTANVKTTIKVGKTNVELFATIGIELWENCIMEYLVQQKTTTGTPQ